jgi:hypothetical protein
MAQDLKYGTITTEHGDIGEDEPVFLFRAKDTLLPMLLDDYLGYCREYGSPENHLDGIIAARKAIVEWQNAHPDQIQVPQSASTEVPE